MALDKSPLAYHGALRWRMMWLVVQGSSQLVLEAGLPYIEQLPCVCSNHVGYWPTLMLITIAIFETLVSVGME